jgi:hypothetical protein
MGFGINYTGNENGIQAPDRAPQPGQSPVIYAPSDLDGASWANIQQSQKRLADEAAYMKSVQWSVWREEYLAQVFDSLSVSSATVTPITNYGQLAAVATGAGASTITFPSSNASLGTAWTPPYLGRGASFNISGTAANYASLTSGRLLTIHAKTILTMEAYVGFWGALPTLNGDFVFGFSNLGYMNAAPTSTPNFCGFWQSGATAGNWLGCCNGVTTTLTGTTPSEKVMQRLKFETFGSATPQGIANGNTGLCRFWVNGTLIGTLSQSPTNAAGSSYPLSLSIGGYQTASRSPAAFVVGGFTIQWNKT